MHAMVAQVPAERDRPCAKLAAPGAHDNPADRPRAGSGDPG